MKKHGAFALTLICLLVLAQSALACDDISIDQPHEKTIVVGDAAIFTVKGECKSHAPPPPRWKIEEEIVSGDSNGIKVFVPDVIWSLTQDQKYTARVAVKGLEPGTEEDLIQADQHAHQQEI